MGLQGDCTGGPDPAGSVAFWEEQEPPEQSLCMHRGKAMWGHRHKPGRGPSPEPEFDLGVLAARTETINVCCLSLPVRGTSLWQPVQTKTPEVFLIHRKSINNHSQPFNIQKPLTFHCQHKEIIFPTLGWYKKHMRVISSSSFAGSICRETSKWSFGLHHGSLG